MKDKLFRTLGNLGLVLYYIFRLIVCCLPFVMIGLGFWGNLVLLLAANWFPLLSIVFWIWGLIEAIGGTQDFWAILYYICFAAIFIPFFIGFVSDTIYFIRCKRNVHNYFK